MTSTRDFNLSKARQMNSQQTLRPTTSDGDIAEQTQDQLPYTEGSVMDKGDKATRAVKAQYSSYSSDAMTSIPSVSPWASQIVEAQLRRERSIDQGAPSRHRDSFYTDVESFKSIPALEKRDATDDRTSRLRQQCLRPRRVCCCTMTTWMLAAIATISLVVTAVLTFCLIPRLPTVVTEQKIRSFTLYTGNQNASVGGLAAAGKIMTAIPGLESAAVYPKLVTALARGGPYSSVQVWDITITLYSPNYVEFDVDSLEYSAYYPTPDSFVGKAAYDTPFKLRRHGITVLKMPFIQMHNFTNMLEDSSNAAFGVACGLSPTMEGAQDPKNTSAMTTWFTSRSYPSINKYFKWTGIQYVPEITGSYTTLCDKKAVQKAFTIM